MDIKKYLKEKKISLKEFSKVCDIPYPTLSKSLNNPESIKIVNFKRMSSFLGLSLEELYSLFFQDGSKILVALVEQKNIKMSGNLYYYTQIQFAYNSNRIEGSKLTEEETRLLYETNTLLENKSTSVDDIFETANHFHLFDVMLNEIEYELSEDMIKRYHELLMKGTSSSYKEWFNVGEYKALANEVGGTSTTNPENVEFEMKSLLVWYLTKKNRKIEDLIEFHYRFEKIHPFQDGNGRVGRMILFRECLKNNIVPFIITDEYKAYYYRGLSEFRDEPGYLMDTCMMMQDNYKDLCKKFLNMDTKDFM